MTETQGVGGHVMRGKRQKSSVQLLTSPADDVSPVSFLLLPPPRLLTRFPAATRPQGVSHVHHGGPLASGSVDLFALHMPSRWQTLRASGQGSTLLERRGCVCVTPSYPPPSPPEKLSRQLSMTSHVTASAVSGRARDARSRHRVISLI